MTRLCRSKQIAQIQEKTQKSEQENDDIEINSNFPIRGKLKPLCKGKLILEISKELEDLDIEMLRINKFYDANISMIESERVKRDKEIIDKIIEKLPGSGKYYVEDNKVENSFIVSLLSNLYMSILLVFISAKSGAFLSRYQSKRQQVAKRESMRLQTDLEFQQNEIKRLNEKYNVEMFSSRVHGGKAYAAEQKIREFKKLLLKGEKAHKATSTSARFDPKKLIHKATANMNNIQSQKYGYSL